MNYSIALAAIEKVSIRTQYVIFGKGSHIQGDACFARLHTRILESDDKEFHYLIRVVDGVDYKKVMEQISGIFSVFEFEYTEITIKEVKCILIELKPKLKLNLRFTYNILNVLFSTFRCVDYEYDRIFRDSKRNMDLYESIEYYVIGSDGSTSHCLNENLGYFYDSACLPLVVKLFFETIQKVCAIEDVCSYDRNTPANPNEKSWKPSYAVGQTPSFSYLEEILENYKKKRKKRINK